MDAQHTPQTVERDAPETAAVNDGGSAFPSEQHQTQDGSWNQTFDPGMSLRDWFAGKIAPALFTANGDRLVIGPALPNDNAKIAAAAYAMADAMLRARATTQVQPVKSNVGSATKSEVSPGVSA
jgi:hypothetical protein